MFVFFYFVLIYQQFLDVLINDIENTDYDLIKKIFEFVIVMICYITVKDNTINLDIIKKLKDQSERVWKEIRTFSDMNLNVPQFIYYFFLTK